MANPAEVKVMPTTVAEQTTEVKLTEKTLSHLDNYFKLQAKFDELSDFIPEAIENAVESAIRVTIRNSYNSYVTLVNKSSIKFPKLSREQAEAELIKTRPGKAAKRIADAAKSLATEYGVKLT